MQKDRKMNREFIKLPVLTVTAVATILLGISSANADDTEIFSAHTTVTPNANVVFMLDTSGSMNSAPTNATDNTTKIQIVKDVFEKLIFFPESVLFFVCEILPFTKTSGSIS